jgi:hypothetical protein
MKMTGSPAVLSLGSILSSGIFQATRTTQQFSITLPLDIAEAVERKVKSGIANSSGVAFAHLRIK